MLLRIYDCKQRTMQNWNNITASFSVVSLDVTYVCISALYFQLARIAKANFISRSHEIAKWGKLKRWLGISFLASILSVFVKKQNRKTDLTLGHSVFKGVFITLTFLHELIHARCYSVYGQTLIITYLLEWICGKCVKTVDAIFGGMFFVFWLKALGGQMVFFNPVCALCLPSSIPLL